MEINQRLVTKSRKAVQKHSKGNSHVYKRHARSFDDCTTSAFIAPLSTTWSRRSRAAWVQGNELQQYRWRTCVRRSTAKTLRSTIRSLWGGGKGSEPLTSTGLGARIREKILLGFEPTPELSAILTVYFIQGALGISRLAVSFFLKDELGLSPAAVASLTAAAALPWLIKPVYGFLTDSLPLFGYRRRSYLVTASAIGTSAWLCLSGLVHSPGQALAAIIATSLSVALSDVVADSIVVERIRDLPAASAGTLQTLCWGSSAVGGLLSAYFSGSLLQILTARQIFGLTAILPAATTALAGLISENRAEKFSLDKFTGVLRKRSFALWDAIRNRSVYLPVLFVFVWQATPSPDAAMFFFTTNYLGFGPEFLGRVRLASSSAALAGLFCYQRFFRKVPIKTLMLGATLVSVPLAMTQLVLVTRVNVALGISDKLFALTDTAVLTALGQIAFMPILVLAAKLCPPGIEGTLFAALMSIFNASGAVANQIGAILTRTLHITENDFTNLWILVVVCSLSGLVALPLLNFLDEVPLDTDDEQEGSTESAEPKPIEISAAPSENIGNGTQFSDEASEATSKFSTVVSSKDDTE